MLPMRPRVSSSNGEEWGSPRKIGWWHARKPSPVYLKLREVVREEVVFEAQVVAASAPLHDVAPVSVGLFVNGTLTTSAAYTPAPRDQLLAWRYDGSLLKVGMNILTLDVPKTNPRTVLRVKSLVLRPAITVAQLPEQPRERVSWLGMPFSSVRNVRSHWTVSSRRS